MKKTLLLVMLVYAYLPLLLSQSIGVDKIITFGNQGWDVVSDLATDDEGNYYVAGSFTGQVNIGDSLLTSAGKRDIFVVKLDSLNTIKWVKRIGTEADEHAHSVSSKNSNYIYLAGSFSGQLDALEAEGVNDAFYMLLDQNGDVQWTKALHSPSAAYKMLLKTDYTGSFYIAGGFKSKLELDENTSLTAQSGVDIFFARFDGNGDLLAYKHIHGEGNIRLDDIEVDQDNNIYIGGGFEKKIHFAPNDSSSNGKEDLYVVKYDSLATRQWYKISGGKYNDRIKALALDNKGNIYMACEFELSTNINTLEYKASKHKDALLIKSAVSDGNTIWRRQLGGGSKNTVSSLTFGNDKVYLSGNFKGSFDVGVEYTTEGSFEDAYIACFEENGNREWFQKVGGSKEDNIWLKYQDVTDQIICTGYFNDDFSFAPHQSTGKNYSDVFVGTLMDCEQVPKVDLGPDSALCYGSPLATDKEYVSYLWSTGSEEAIIYPQSSGTYIVEVEDDYGCFTKDTVEIIITPLPVVDLGPDTTAGPNEFIFLDAGEGYQGYEWSSGETCRLLCVPMDQIDAPTDFSVTITDNFGCPGGDMIRISPAEVPPAIPPAMAINSNPSINGTIKTGNKNSQTKEEEKQEDIIGEKYQVFPNPTNGKLTVLIPKPDEVRFVHIYNIQGNLVKAINKPISTKLEIDFSNYTKGTYLVKIVGKNELKEFKVIRN